MTPPTHLGLNGQNWQNWQTLSTGKHKNWKNWMEKMASISLMDSRDPTHHLMEKSTKLQRRYFWTLPLDIHVKIFNFYPNLSKFLQFHSKLQINFTQNSTIEKKNITGFLLLWYVSLKLNHAEKLQDSGRFRGLISLHSASEVSGENKITWNGVTLRSSSAPH